MTSPPPAPTHSSLRRRRRRVAPATVGGARGAVRVRYNSTRKVDVEPFSLIDCVERNPRPDPSSPQDEEIRCDVPRVHP